MKVYGYARVSAQDQNIARQIDAFTSLGIDPDCIYIDKQSGKDFERVAYKKLLKKLEKGDVLYIKTIDRLGRDYDAIIHEWNRITNEIGSDIVVIDIPVLDTRPNPDNPVGKCNLVGKFISDVFLGVLSFVAEHERSNIRQRQKEGIEAAKRRGVKFGRPATNYSPEFIATVAAYFNGSVKPRDAVKTLNLTHQSFYYHADRLRLLGYLSEIED